MMEKYQHNLTPDQIAAYRETARRLLLERWQSFPGNRDTLPTKEAASLATLWIVDAYNNLLPIEDKEN